MYFFRIKIISSEVILVGKKTILGLSSLACLLISFILFKNTVGVVGELFALLIGIAGFVLMITLNVKYISKFAEFIMVVYIIVFIILEMKFVQGLIGCIDKCTTLG